MRDLLEGINVYCEMNGRMPADTSMATGVSWRGVLAAACLPIPQDAFDLEASFDSPRNEGLRRTRWLADGERAWVWGVRGVGTFFDSGVGISRSPSTELIIIEAPVAKKPWLQIEDLWVDRLNADMNGSIGNVLGCCDGSVLVGFADREVWAISCDTPVGVLVKACRSKGMSRGDRETLFEPFRRKRMGTR